ncbi:MAG: tetratricopeptide repeat protein [Sphingomonas sp.]|nr:tetratricopeptide repeat protein [Sphingomonas sp.]
MILYLLVLAIQVACVVDVIRNGRNQLWIMALVFLPGASTIAYVLIEVLPRLQGNRHVRTVRAQVEARLDPERDLRAARDALGLADTIANRIRLADALVGLGRHDEAVPLYREALARAPDTDPRTEAKLAAALFETGESGEARTLLDAITPPSTQSDRDRLTLLRARVLTELGEADAALALYADIVTRMPGEEARCRYAALLLDQGYAPRARAVLEEIEARMKRLDRTQRAADAEMYKWAMDKLRALRAAG